MLSLLQRLVDATGTAVSSAILFREAARSSRRWQTYAARTLFSGLLIATLLLSIQVTLQAASNGILDIATIGQVGRGIFIAFATTQLVLVSILAPLTTATAVAEESDERTLDLLMLTRLTPRQIILGKVFSRVAMLLTMVLGAMPVLLLAVNMGGVSGLEVVAVTVHALTTAVLMSALGAFFALFTRSPFLSTIASVAYIVPFFLILPGAYALGVGDPTSAAHFSPLAGALATDFGALITPISYLPTLIVIFGLLVPMFALKASRAAYSEAFSNDIWRTMTWLKGVAIWLVLSITAVFALPAAWLDEGSNPSTMSLVMATIGGGWMWMLTATLFALATWVYLRVACDVVDGLDGLFSSSRKITPSEEVNVGARPVWWRETTHGTLRMGPVVATWGMVMLTLLQTGWWLVPGGILAMGIANGAATMLLTAWLGTRAFTEERRERTLETLIITTLPSHRIVSGKLAAVLWPAMPLWVATGPLLVLGVPHLRMLQWFGDTSSGEWWWLVSGLFAWAWLLPVLIVVATASMVVGLRARTPRSAFGLVVGWVVLAVGPAVVVGQLFPDLAVFSTLARLWAPAASGHANALHYFASIAFWSAIAIALPFILTRRLRDWALRVLLLLITFSAAAPLAQAQAAEEFEQLNQLRMTASPLAEGLVRSDGWMLVNVRLENLGEPTTGVLVLDDQTDDRETARWTRDVELAGGATKDVQLLFAANAGGPNRAISYVTSSGRRADGAIRLQVVAPSTLTIAVLGMDPLGLPAALRTATSEALPRSGAHDTPPGEEEDRLAKTAVIPNQELPVHSMALRNLDWIVWSDPDPGTVSDAQAGALVSWVADGGHLFLSVTETTRQLHDSPLGPLLPGRIGPPSTQHLLPFVSRVDPDAIESAPVPVASLSAGPRTTIVERTSEGAPLWVVVPFGLGTVHVLLTDLTLSPISDLDREALWRMLLWAPENGVVTPPEGEQLQRTFLAHTSSEDFQKYEESVRKELSDVPGLAPIPITWLVLASALYLFVIGPLDYAVLRMTKRQPYTWITFPVAIVVFTIGSAAALRSTKGSEAMLTRLEIIQVLPDAERWRGDTFFGVFSTRKTDLVVIGGFPDSAIQPLDEPGFLPSPSLSGGLGPGQLRYRAETWTMAYARSSWTHPKSGQLRYTHTSAGMTLTNDLGIDVLDVGLYDGKRRVAAFGPLANGATAELPAGGRQGTPTEALSRYEDLDQPFLPSRGHIDDEAFQLVAITDVGVEPLRLDGLTTVPKSFVILRQTTPKASLDAPEPTDTP